MTDEMAIPATGTIVSERPFTAFLRHMEQLAELDTSSGGGNAANTVEAILAAETEQEMWEADEQLSIGGRNLANVEQEIIDFDVKFGQREDVDTVFIGPETGRKMYVLVTATRISKSPEMPGLGVGETFTWNTSAPALVAKLFWARKNNRLPGWTAVIRSTDLGGGQAVIKFKPIPERAVKADTTAKK
jgi:hypothetical protein